MDGQLLKNTNRSTTQTIRMTIERFIRQMPGRCRRSGVCSEGHLLQPRLTLIIGVIFFVAPQGTEPRAPRTPASAAVLGGTSDMTVEHRSPTVCRQKSLLSRATHSHFPGVRQHYLPQKREVPENSGTEVKYNFTSFADNKTDL